MHFEERSRKDSNTVYFLRVFLFVYTLVWYFCRKTGFFGSANANKAYLFIHRPVQLLAPLVKAHKKKKIKKKLKISQSAFCSITRPTASQILHRTYLCVFIILFHSKLTWVVCFGYHFFFSFCVRRQRKLGFVCCWMFASVAPAVDKTKLWRVARVDPWILITFEWCILLFIPFWKWLGEIDFFMVGHILPPFKTNTTSW